MDSGSAAASTLDLELADADAPFTLTRPAADGARWVPRTAHAVAPRAASVHNRLAKILHCSTTAPTAPSSQVSLERKDRTLGYTKENCVLIAYALNTPSFQWTKDLAIEECGLDDWE